MTRHATPEQWAEMEQWAGGHYSTSACLIELLDRIAAMEAQRETEKACIQEIYDKLDRLKVQHESNWSRIVKLEEALVTLKIELITERNAKPQAPAPAGGLVERVAAAANCYPLDDARAAILAVAEWFDAIGYGATASILRQEVERG